MVHYFILQSSLIDLVKSVIYCLSLCLKKIDTPALAAIYPSQFVKSNEANRVHIEIKMLIAFQSSVVYEVSIRPVCYDSIYKFLEKRIKRVTIQDLTSQQIFDLEKLFFYSY